MRAYRRLLADVVVHWPRLLAAGLCAGVLAATTAGYAWLVKYWLDDALIAGNLTMLVLISLAIPAVALVKSVSSYGESYLLRHVGNSIVCVLRERLYGHLLALPVGYYATQRIGGLMSRFTNDINVIQSLVTVGFIDLMQHGLTLVVLLGYVFYLNWKLALLAVIVLPVSYILLVRVLHRLKRLSTVMQEQLAGLTAMLQESLVGLRVIKAFAKEEFAREEFRQQNARVFTAYMRLVRLMEFVPPVIEVAGALGFALVVWYGGRQVLIDKAMSPGELFSFLVACGLLYGPVKRLSTVGSQLQPVMAAADRIFAILDQPTEMQMDRGRIELTRVERGIEFERVSFRYEPDSPPALQEVSLRIGAGELVALVGSSGSGKSTIVNLIARFYEPSSGRVLLDGHDLRDVRLTALRRLIGIVSQETILFQDTVRNNIAFGRADLPLEAVIEAAKAAYAHNFITALSRGYDTVIGERGLTLSGGERQRLAIARAFLINPPILILDEATSALDYESEAIVQQALNDLIKGRTTLVVAHRLSTVQQADRILVLEGGRIVEEGAHEPLLRQNGVYRRLYDRQFRDDESESLLGAAPAEESSRHG
ncbi:MAG: ATP-binding cassette domain-containing protein [Nitrospirae bacterium]|nr:ATP-binding cassette domain-containing protein [Nitrospirota bacterium]